LAQGPPRLSAETTPTWEALSGADRRAQLSSVRALRKRDAVLRRALGLSDALAGYLAVTLTMLVVDGGAVGVRPTIVLAAPFFVLVSKALGLYDRDQHRLRKVTIDEAPTLLHLAVIYALTVWLTEGILLHGALGRAQVLVLTAVGFALAFACRAAARAIVLGLSTPERCIVVGNVDDATRAANRLGCSGTNAIVVGRVALHGETAVGAAGAGQALGDSRMLADLIEIHAAERVIIAPGDHGQEEVLELIRLVTALGVKLSVLPRLLEVVGSSSVFDEVDGISLLGVRQFGLSKSSEFLKRAMDIAGASCGLVLAAPVLALMAVAIMLDSRGAPLFVQSRIGRQGKRFAMIKLRSMVQGADQLKDEIRDRNEVDGGLFKIANDPRITRVGRLLRRTSLDELPQLVNVLRGDMSLVGPRPLALDEDALIEGWGRRRLAIKPGMTGLWQIFGSSRIPMPEMVKIDYLYGANWSIWLDLKILLRTVPHVLARRGV
jgi:exopolysaccharide biosynthesis polyprenyl glycosylphosphotransferase